MQVTVEFVGGSHDGLKRTFPWPINRNPVDDDESTAVALWALSNGVLGHGLQTGSRAQHQVWRTEGVEALKEAKLKPCVYVVTDRIDDGDDVYIRGEYRPDA